jgi:hypothetical protein
MLKQKIAKRTKICLCELSDLLFKPPILQNPKLRFPTEPRASASGLIFDWNAVPTEVKREIIQ